VAVRTKVLLFVLAMLGGGLGIRYWQRGLGSLNAPPASLASAWTTEEQWMVASIANDLDAMAVHAREGRPASPAAAALPAPLAASGDRAAGWTITLAGAPRALPLPDGPWSVESHAALAAELLAARGVEWRPDPATAEAELLESLATPTVEVLQESSRRAADALRAGFTRAQAHEEAALVLGTFALREADTSFADARPALNRMTAHLAFASALRQGGERSLSGRYAEALHATLAGRAADAMAALSALRDGALPPQPAWLNALALRNTQDWRAFGDPQGRTLLERLEYLRALCATESAAEVATFVSAGDLEPLADWRLLAAPASLGVELADWSVLPGLDPLLAEMAASRAAAGLPPLEGAGLVAALRERPGPAIGPAGPQVLDWGAWAGFYSRAVAAHVALADRHLRRVLHDAASADDYQARMDRDWGGLDLYPVAATHRTRRMEMNLDRIADAIALALERPETITAHNWGRLADGAPYEPLRRGMPRAAAWFAPTIVRGTAFDAAHRLARLPGGPDAAGTQALARLHPYDLAVATAALGPRPDAAALEQALGARAGFDQRAADAIAEAAETARPEQKGALLTRQCAQSSGRCLDLGHHLADLGREPEAAAAFEKAFADPALDAVLLSHHSGWLVRYRLRQGDRAGALALAEAALRTGSGSGYGVHADLMERLERFAEAERSFAARADRYDDQGGLIAFYYRAARVHGRREYEARLQRAARTVFPDGLQPVGAPETLGTTAPTDGACVMRHSRALLAAGLRTGDVVVGLDGFRIRTAAQYAAVRRFSREDAMVFSFWRGGAYHRAEATVPDRWMGVGLVDFPIRGWVDGNPEVGG
jgi:hypothetical protein